MELAYSKQIAKKRGIMPTIEEAQVRQCGNGGTAMSRGNHSSQKKGGGSAAGSAGTGVVMNVPFGQKGTNPEISKLGKQLTVAMANVDAKMAALKAVQARIEKKHGKKQEGKRKAGEKLNPRNNVIPFTRS